MIKTKWIEKRLDYDGSQLRSLWNYLDHGILGDSMVAFRGACDISFEKMVDGEDLLDRSVIQGSDMIHFIVEIFDAKLVTAVALQRLLASIARDAVEELAPSTRGQWLRDGDDLFIGGSSLKDGGRKLSISIATASPVSSLIHFAVNVSTDGTPVPTAGLQEFGINPETFAKNVLARFEREMAGIWSATRKVRWVP